MTASLTVLEPGLASSIQDFGRIGYQRLGVPVSGALDRVALAAANIVVGNAPGEAAIECLYAGPLLEVTSDSVRVAVAGAGASLAVDAAGIERRNASCRSVLAQRGDRLRVVIAGPAISAYLAVEGGFDLPSFLGSRSTYVRAQLGGLDGRVLRRGDSLPLRQHQPSSRSEVQLSDVPLAPASTVRVVLGPQADHFTPAAVETFLSASFTVSPVSDRMGLRLVGPQLAHAKGFNIPSDAIPPGAIQVPGDGHPIVLLADRQTTGGYPKIATVISADVPALGRVGPGTELQFSSVGITEAERLAREFQAQIASWPQRLEPAEVAADPAALLAENLISGVIDGGSRASGKGGPGLD